MAKVLSIEIGIAITRIVEMEYMAKKPTVYRYAELKTPEGAVEDGYLNPQKLETLASIIKSTLKEKKMRAKKVQFTVFSGKIISREVLLPSVRVNQIDSVIKANLTEYFPIQLEGYKVAHIHANTVKEGENAGKHKVLVLAAEERLLEGYEKLAQLLGFALVDIDYAGNGVIQLMKKLAGAQPVMAVKLEDENAIISIFHQGALVLQRTINHAFGRLMESEADIEDATEVLVSTMLRIADFYSLNDENEKIEQIYFVGNGSKDLRVIAEVEKKMQITCMVLEQARAVELGKNAADIPINLYAAVIGSGIASVGFDNEQEKQRRETNYPVASILMIVFYIVLIVALFMNGRTPYQEALDEQTYYQGIKETLASGQELYEKHENMKTLRTEVEAGHALTQNSNDHLLEFLGQLEEALPSDIEVTYLLSDAAGCEMMIFISDKEKAAGIIRTLREFESLYTVVVERIDEVYEDTAPEGNEDEESENAEKKSIGVEFLISCYYTGGTQDMSIYQTIEEAVTEETQVVSQE